MKVYISGKVSGLPFRHVRRKFERAERFLRNIGHHPVNPLKLPHEPYGRWDDFMSVDITHLIGCDAVYALNDWRDSTGARLEVKIAHRLGKLIIFQHAKAPKLPAGFNQSN